jgi:hypothetical protein
MAATDLSALELAARNTLRNPAALAELVELVELQRRHRAREVKAATMLRFSEACELVEEAHGHARALHLARHDLARVQGALERPAAPFEAALALVLAELAP